MASNKKQIVDFLWEWADNHGDWAKHLITKIVTTESILSDSDRSVIFDYFLQSINLNEGLPKLTNLKPQYDPTIKKIELTTLSNVLGVNRLAPNQELVFSENLTVIFGENGTGKTGYGRILKSLGFSYDKNNMVLSNIFGSPQAKEALINYKVNGVEEVFNWNGSNRNSDLEYISVFNTNCVQLSLSDRQLIVSPIGFHLFNLVTLELNELNKLLETKKASLQTTFNWSYLLNPNTPQANFINQLNRNSSIQELNNISSFSINHVKELEEREKEFSNLNKNLLLKEIQILSVQLSEMQSFISIIKNAQTNFNEKSWKLLIEINKKIALLEGKTKTGIKEIAESNGIIFYESIQFQDFIKAAEEYIKIIDKNEYPIQDDVCIYCMQPLINNKAITLIQNYRSLLNDKSEANLLIERQKKADLINQISQIETNLNFQQNTFGTNESQMPIQPNTIIEYNNILKELKRIFITGDIADDSNFNFDYTKYTNFLIEKVASTNVELAQKKELLNNISSKETDLKKVIDELKDRKLLSSKLEEIKLVIENHKTLFSLNSFSGSLNTNSISRKTTEARSELLESNFNSIFKSELSSFRKSHLNIDFNFGTDRGSSKVTHRINSHALIDILSEGEQKGIALAEFLTELQLDPIIAPVIFDDPVNSLDHNIIDDVSRRLVKLSTERQVVIFTHSVLLFNSLLFYSRENTFSKLDYKFYNSKNEFDETGFLTEAEEEINKVKVYINKINVIINNTPKDRPERELAEDGYGYLRSAIELLVEHEIFQGTVKRYQKNVALTQFIKIDGILLNEYKEKLNEIYVRCCGFIKGHSNPIPVYQSPTINDLTVDFNEFIIIRNSFI